MFGMKQIKMTVETEEEEYPETIKSFEANVKELEHVLDLMRKTRIHLNMKDVSEWTETHKTSLAQVETKILNSVRIEKHDLWESVKEWIALHAKNVV